MTYWNSSAGITTRLQYLADDIAMRTFNNAIQIYASSVGYKYFKWHCMFVNSCEYCIDMHGRVYRRGQFMPRMPAHPSGRCMWDIVKEE